MSLEYRAVHHASDKIEPRMAKAILVAVERLRTRIPYRALENALERKDVRKATEILAKVDIEDGFVPSSEILKESVTRGGKIADEETRNG